MHAPYRIDRWDFDGNSVLERVATVDDFRVALDTYHAACKRWPGECITLRQGAHVIEDNRKTRIA
jgi:hypothetical protein